MNIHTPVADTVAYEDDFTAWLLSQARRLREKDASALDWQNLAEEIESMGLSQQRELRSRLMVILIHWLKLQLSHSDRPRAKWRTTIRTQRTEIEGLLRQSPSLRRMVPGIVDDGYADAREIALGELEEHEAVHMDEYRAAVGHLSHPDPDKLLNRDQFPAVPD